MLKTDYAVVLSNRSPIDVIRLIERDTEIRIAYLKRAIRDNELKFLRDVYVGHLKELRRMRRQLARYEYDEKEGRGRFTLAYDVTRRGE